MPLRSAAPLSKSRYMAGLQCLKRLYLQVRAEDVIIDPDDPASAARMSAGTRLGELARTRHPGGRLIAEGPGAHADAVRATHAAMLEPTLPAIFEAAFTHAGVKVRVDLLVRLPDDAGWELHEVKAVLHPGEGHLHDLALQLWVLRGAGVPVIRAGILHLDAAYVRGPFGLDVDRLFCFSDRTAPADALAGAIGREVARMQAVLGEDAPPVIATGRHCVQPHPCPYRTHCGWVEENIPPTSVRNVPKGSGLVARAHALGIDDVRQLPPNVARSARHKAVVASLSSGVPHVGGRLGAAMAQVRHPIGFVDFETYTPVVPEHPGTRPMQALPTQWSLHVLHADGSLQHSEFLHDGVSDPRHAFTTSLLDATAGCGSLVTYSDYEERQVKALMRDLPEHSADLDARVALLVDLCRLLTQHYYHPGFRASYSLKRVAPVLAPSVRYDGLAVANGMAAVEAYGRLRSASEAERAALRADLLAYCRVDTLAMVAIWRALAAAVGGP